MNEDDKWQLPIGFQDFVGGFKNQKAVQQVRNLNELAARERYIQQLLDRQKSSEIVRVHTPEGETSTSPLVIGISAADPVGQVVVESVALGKPLTWVGKGALYGLARYGVGKPQNWARATLFSKELNSATPKIKPVGLWSPSLAMSSTAQLPTQNFWEELTKKLPLDLIVSKKTYKYNPNSALSYVSQDAKFSPMVTAKIGKFNELYADETINRLKGLGYDVESPLTIYYKGARTLVTPSTHIRNNAKKPVYLGLYDNPGISGHYYGSNDIAIVDPTYTNNLASLMFHERNMHGTDGVVETLSSAKPEARQMYLDFVNKLFYVEHNNPLFSGTTINDYAQGVIKKHTGGYWISDRNKGTVLNALDETSNWNEARATINELKRYYLYDLWKKAGKPLTLESLRSPYLKKIDRLSDWLLETDLANKTNGYGQAYVALKRNNPQFIPNLKHLLKYGAMYGVPTAVGAKTFYNILLKKSGGKLISRNTILNFKNKRL